MFTPPDGLALHLTLSSNAGCVWAAERLYLYFIRKVSEFRLRSMFLIKIEIELLTTMNKQKGY